MEKMKVTSLAELVIVAERLGVLAVESEAPAGEGGRPENPPAGDDK
jgi:hypothetical protein